MISRASRPVLAADIGNAYTTSRAAGLVPYCSVVDLNVMRVNPGWDP